MLREGQASFSNTLSLFSSFHQLGLSTFEPSLRQIKFFTEPLSLSLPSLYTVPNSALRMAAAPATQSLKVGLEITQSYNNDCKSLPTRECSVLSLAMELLERLI